MTDTTPPANEPEQPVTPPAAPEPPAAAVPPVPPPAAPAYGAPVEAKPPTILSLLSMIGGIAGLVLACCGGAGILFSIAAIIMGHLAPAREPAGRGMAKTGLITGYIGAALSVIVWILLFAAPFLFLPFYGMIPGMM